MSNVDHQSVFFDTARERYRILLNKRLDHKPYWMQSGGPEERSYTPDPIFQKYRFCNVFREDDKVTAYFRNNIRSRMSSLEQHVRAAVAFRWFNLPATGELLLPWLLGDETIVTAEDRVTDRADDGNTILNAAYMIKSPPGMRKAEGIFHCMREVEAKLGYLTECMHRFNTLEDAVRELAEFPYLGPFMAYQAVCDLRFTPVLNTATDINDWTSPGPGSARGIGRIFKDDVKAYNYNSRIDRKELIEKMRYLLQLSRFPEYWPKEWDQWELSTVQHWACEYDKYMRAYTGEGEPKQKYRPAS